MLIQPFVTGYKNQRNYMKNPIYTGEEINTLSRSIECLKDLTKTQCSDGNWNYDPYMHGMANGLILALSLFQSGTPQFLEAPEDWLSGNSNPIPLTGLDGVDTKKW
jgi:hypothetical protein